MLINTSTKACPVILVRLIMYLIKKKWNKSPLLSIFAKPMTKLSNDMCLNYR